MRHIITILLLLMVSALEVKAEVDPKFQIYLCFGQSNMAGDASAEAVDMDVDNRFLTLEATNGTPTRAKGVWYVATPPIVTQGNYTKIGMADYFGRTMVAALPGDYRVGVVDVAVNGADIKGFMSEFVAAVNIWHTDYFARYDDDPYRRLVDMARIAQQSGVIKGILLHQGEANVLYQGEQKWGDPQWPLYVKTIYDRLLKDLKLDATEVPLLVGEVVNASEGGDCAVINEVIAQVPSVIPTAHVISSFGCPTAGGLHFSLEGYRIMGKRYAIKMLELLDLPDCQDAHYTFYPSSLREFYRANRLETLDDIILQPNETREIPAIAYFGDGHQENVASEVVVTCTGKGVSVNGNKITGVTGKRSLVTVSYNDFTGKTVSTSFYVNRSQPIVGDVNGDDVVDEEDLKAVINHILDKPQEEEFDVNMANINKDDKVDVADVVLLIKLMDSGK